jgi:hypothetical protein
MLPVIAGAEPIGSSMVNVTAPAGPHPHEVFDDVVATAVQTYMGCVGSLMTVSVQGAQTPLEHVLCV